MDCEKFFNDYGVPGRNFTCHPSRVDPSIIVVNLNLDQVRRNLVYSLAIPIPCLIFSLIYIIVAYTYIYKERKQVFMNVNYAI